MTLQRSPALRRCYAALGLCVMFHVGTASLAAQSPINAALDASSELVLLKRVLVEQERRISQLEARLGASSPPIPAEAFGLGSERILSAVASPERTVAKAVVERANPVPAWSDASRWRKIKRGMRSAQVLALLGLPQKDDTSVPAFRSFVYQSNSETGTPLFKGVIDLYNDKVFQVRTPNF